MRSITYTKETLNLKKALFGSTLLLAGFNDSYRICISYFY